MKHFYRAPPGNCLCTHYNYTMSLDHKFLVDSNKKPKTPKKNNLLCCAENLVLFVMGNV